MNFGALWTPADDRALRSAYRSGGIAAARIALPSRSNQAIYHRAWTLGVTRRRRWTPKEDAILRREWHATPLKDIARLLGRTVVGVYRRANDLDLLCECPQGFEYLSTAAKRCGYHTKQLRRILRWYGTTLRPIRGCQGEVAKRARHLLEIGDADAAVAAWIAVGTSVAPWKPGAKARNRPADVARPVMAASGVA